MSQLILCREEKWEKERREMKREEKLKRSPWNVWPSWREMCHLCGLFLLREAIQISREESSIWREENLSILCPRREERERKTYDIREWLFCQRKQRNEMVEKAKRNKVSWSCMKRKKIWRKYSKALHSLLLAHLATAKRESYLEGKKAEEA